MKTVVAQALREAGRVLVMAHRDPDGDALGSVLGLMHLLTANGKQARCHINGAVPPEYAFLPGLETLDPGLPAPEWPELVVLLDCHEPDRTGPVAAPYLEAAPRVAVVDHHLGEATFGDPRWVEPAQAATAQMVAGLAADLGWAMTPAAATCLYTGLVTDTGRFCYSNTTPLVLRAAADLVEAGADPWAITQRAYSTSLERLKLFGRVLASLELLADGRLALARARQADLDDLGCPPSDLD
ncbi:MAG: DHH family phosphoesterase, partial [Desulfarculus sp.]|nr:DHH family phosphoesterase [Desulfarculus sp.]